MANSVTKQYIDALTDGLKYFDSYEDYYSGQYIIFNNEVCVITTCTDKGVFIRDLEDNYNFVDYSSISSNKALEILYGK